MRTTQPSGTGVRRGTGSTRLSRSTREGGRRAHGPWRRLLLAAALVASCGGAASPTPVATAQRLAVPAGEYRSNAFGPPITYQLPAGWLVADDGADYFALQPVTSDQVGIYVFRSPLAASQDQDCPLKPAPDTGTTAKELVDWTRARPGLVVGDPVPVTVGGFSGLQADVAIVEGWKASCPFANGVPTAPLFVSPTDPNFRWVVAGSERIRLIVLDVPAKGTVVVDIDAFDGSLMDGFLPAATPIVATMKFGLP
jgi:hypothetical protein